MREFRITFALTDDNIRRLKGDVAEERIGAYGHTATATRLEVV